MRGIGHRKSSDEEQLIDGYTSKGTGQYGEPVATFDRPVSSLKGHHHPEQGCGDQYAGDVQAERFDPKGCRLLCDAEVYGENDIGCQNGAVCEPGFFQIFRVLRNHSVPVVFLSTLLYMSENQAFLDEN